MKTHLLSLYYTLSAYIEIIYLNTFNLKDKSVIPEGPYCYTIDHEKDKSSPLPNGYHIKTCKYYRWINQGKRACLYLNFVGDDICLYDQCKMCSENKGYDEDPTS